MARGYLLDTNVVSETRKRLPNESVTSFLAQTNPSSLYISVLTIGEMRKGVALRLRSDPQTAQALTAWVDTLETLFADRILSIDTAAATLWGDWSAQRSRPVVDTLLAATASRHHLTLVTRNVADVQGLPIEVLNPWNWTGA